MPEEHDNIEIRSEEVQEILSEVPVWLIRWGITTVFGIVLIIILLSWIMEYPDVVPGQVVLTTKNPPTHMFVKSSGNIDLLVDEDEFVKKGTILAVIENPAKFEDVLALDSTMKKMYQSLHQDDFDPFALQLTTNYDLGTIQPQFGAFYAAVRNATRVKKFAADLERVKSAEEDLAAAERLQSSLLNRLDKSKEELKIAKKLFKFEGEVFSFGGSDSVTYLNSKRNFLNAEGNFESLQSQVIQNESAIRRAESSLRGLEFNNEDSGEILKNAVKEAYEALESSIYSWKDRFIIESPKDGNVSLSKFWSDNQYISGGEELLVIIPNGEDVIGRLDLPIAGSGKVAIGQKVNIKLDNYPSNDYGMLRGNVESISSVPRDGKYSVQIKIPQDLMSSYNKKIPFKQEMLGQADIITEDKKLFHRIFNQLRELLDKAT